MLISSNPIMTAIRSIFVVTDVGIYALLRFMYELFFNIATFNVVDREMIFNIISRVQLIVGVYMMFQLILIIIRGIINPDSFTDSKTGAGNLIMRIIVSLSLLALIVPINIPSPKNEYEKQINNSGILFGTLYSLQYRILTNNTLGRIILGQEGTNYTSSNPDGQYLVTFGNRFVSVIAKSFYSIYRDESGDSVCDDKWVDEYNKEDIWPEEVIVLGLKHCKGKYFLNMTMLISSVAGIVLVVIMFMMCFEVAKRVFQLAALQLLAPIPIISYMDPKGSKDGAFSSWVKLLSKTYLDLFTRLTVIYFTLAVIEGFINKFFSNMVESNLNTWQGDALAAYELNRWTFIILCIALFIFAKDAPKFFKQMLGIKSEGKFFDAFGQALGVGAVGAGAVSGGVSGAVSRYKNADSSMTRGQKIAEAIKGGATGAVGRLFNAAGEYKKGNSPASILQNNKAAAARNWEDAENKSKFSDATRSRVASGLGLKDNYQNMKDHVDALKGAHSAFERLDGILSKDGKKDSDYSSIQAEGKSITGLGMTTGDHSIKDLVDHYKMMQASGATTADQRAMDSIIKEAKRRRSLEIAQIGDGGGAGFATNNDGKRDINGESAYQEIQTMWKYGGKYKDDEDGVFETLKGKTQSQEMFSNSTEYGKTKGAFGSGASQRADNIENSTEFKDAKNAHERANRKPGS